MLARADAPLSNPFVRALSLRNLAVTGDSVPPAQHYEAVALSGFSASGVKTRRAMLLRLYKNATPLA